MYYLINSVKFVTSSVSNVWLFWYVSHTSITWNSDLNVFKKIWLFGDISDRLLNDLFGTNVCKTL